MWGSFPSCLRGETPYSLGGFQSPSQTGNLRHESRESHDFGHTQHCH